MFVINRRSAFLFNIANSFAFGKPTVADAQAVLAREARCGKQRRFLNEPMRRSAALAFKEAIAIQECALHKSLECGGSSGEPSLLISYHASLRSGPAQIWAI